MKKLVRVIYLLGKKIKKSNKAKAIILVLITLLISKMLFKNNTQTIEKTIVKENDIVVVFIPFEEEETKENQQIIEETTTTNIPSFDNDNEQAIYNEAINQGLTKEQAFLLISISRHETGKWTSKAFINNNNFGGIMDIDGLRDYDTYEEGLKDFVRILKTYYFEKGLNTIAEIGAKYCPVGAENDPQGLNQYWVGGVTDFYNYYVENY